MNIYSYLSARDFLKSVLSEKMANNRRLSLRSVARKSSISPSSLNDYVLGKSCLSLENAIKLAGALSVESAEFDYFIYLVIYEGIRDERSKSVLLERLNARKPQAH